MTTKQVNGVLLEKVKRNVLNMSVRELLGVDPRGKKEHELIKMLAEHFAKDPLKNQACDVCHGCSDPELTKACPFCGDEDVPDEDGLSMSDGPRADAPVSPAAIVKANNLAGAVIVHAKPTLSIKDLTKWEEEYTKAREATAEDMWNVGRLLKECQDSNLWRLPLDTKGQQLHANFYDYLSTAQGVTRMAAQKLLRFHTEFALGLAKKYSKAIMNKVLTMPEQARTELLLAAKEEDLSEKQIAERIDIKKKIERDAKHTPPSKQPEKDRDKLVTLVVKPQKQHIKLLTYGDNNRRAKKILDRPVAVVDLERGQLLFEVAIGKDGNLELIMKAMPRRTEEA